MKLDQFLTKHNTALSGPVLSLCQDGLQRMNHSIDVLHDVTHTERLLSSLDQLMEHETKIRWKQVNISALLLAISWHDVWKSTRFPTAFHTLLIDQYWDGLGSMRLFAEAVKLQPIPLATYQRARYAIRVHGKFRQLPLRTIESRILKDIDRLDQWSSARLDRLVEKFPSKDHIKPRHVTLAKFYYRYFLARQPDNYYFAWTRQEFAKRKKDQLQEISRLISDYETA